MDFQKGDVVLSLAGRDKGCLLAVTGEENGFVLVADGRERPLERAKVKNPRHLEKTSVSIDSVSMAGNKILRKTLNRLSKQGR